MAGFGSPTFAQAPDEIAVIPGAPTEEDRVTLLVPGLACFNSQPSPLYESANVSIRGRAIGIELAQAGWSCFSAGDPLVDKPLAIDVGKLVAGSYCVNFTRSMAGNVNMVRQLAFTVGAAFTAEPACGSAILVSSSYPAEIAFVSTSSNEVRSRLQLPSAHPVAIRAQMSPDGNRAYVVTYSGAAPPNVSHPGRSLLVVDVPRQAIVGEVALPDYTELVVVGPDEHVVYAAASAGVSAVSLVDGTRRQAVGSIAPRDLLLSPGGKFLYALGNEETEVYETTSMTRFAVHAIGGNSFAMSPDGSTLYFAAVSGTSTGVAGYSISDRKKKWLAVIPSRDTVGAIAVSPDGSKAYALYPGERAVAIVDTTIGAYTGAIDISPSSAPLLNPMGLAVTADGERIVVPGMSRGGDLATNVVALDTREVMAVVRGYGYFKGAFDHVNGSFVAPRRASLPVAVEYFHAGFDHYFVTSDAAEIEKLDTGSIAGWSRTGETFKVFATRRPDTYPATRYFSNSFGSKSSHFYTLRAPVFLPIAPPQWTYESDAFFMGAPNVTGDCPDGMVPIYRYYNRGQGGAPNHRLVADPSVRNAMIAAGWVPEGYGAGVSMCGPA